MRPLNVDFAPRRRLPWVAVSCVLSIALVCGAAWLAWQAQQAAGQLAQAQRERQALELSVESAAALAGAAASAPAAPAHAADVQRWARAAVFPWDGVFASLESAQVPGVRLVAFEAATADGQAKAELEYPDNDALTRYLAALNAGEPQPRWRLVRAQAGIGGAPGSATVSSAWVAYDSAR